MHIILNHSSMVPIYEQLMEQIKSEIIHGKGTFVTASDKQLAVEARKRAVEEEFDKAIDKAVSVGMNQNEILELVQLLLDEK